MFSLLLFLILLGVMGVQTVHSRSVAVSCRYDLAKMLLREKKLDEELLLAQARLAQLLSPERLRDGYGESGALTALRVAGGKE